MSHSHQVGLFWFRSDLRLEDNEALTAAIAQCEKVVPVFCFSPRLWEKHPLGFSRTGAHRIQFLKESLDDLQTALQELGNDLWIVVGEPAEKLPEIAEKVGATVVFGHREAATEEIREEEAVANKIDLELYWGSTLYHLEDLPMPVASLPAVFGGFRRKVEKKSSIREVFARPTAIPGVDQPANQEAYLHLFPEFVAKDKRTAFPFKGGSNAALARLKEYLWEGDHLGRYKLTRNGLVGTNYSSKFSPWLANGSLSPRTIYQEVKRYEEARVKNDSTYWLVFELIWRDFFHFVSLQHGRNLFLYQGLQRVDPRLGKQQATFWKWAEGRTKDGFVNANQLELSSTGWMSNRGRQNAASYLVHDMGIDWRWGAAWFESQLLDYDPCSNYGNWQYVTGIGNDTRTKKFDTQWQAERYDPKGRFQQLWTGMF